MNKKILVMLIILILFVLLYSYVWYRRISTMKEFKNKHEHETHNCFFCDKTATKVRTLDPDAKILADIENGEMLLQISEAEKMVVYSCEECMAIAGTFRTTKWKNI